MESYKFKSEKDGEYTFFSIGGKGIFEITVRFELFHVGDQIYHLEFGIMDKSTGVIDTSFVLNNNDTKIIINTVENIVDDFIGMDPQKLVRFSGRTNARTRLFMIWLSSNLEDLRKKLTIYGYREGFFWSVYKKNIRYESIILKRKV